MVLRFAIVACFAALMLLSAGAKATFVDDTFITLQYAWTFVQHGVPTWHPDLPLVDGYTSFLHVALLAAGYAAGIPLIPLNSALAIGAAVSVLALFVAATRHLSPFAVAAGLGLISLNTGFLFWIGGGLDAVLYVAVFFASYLAYERAWRRGRIDTALGLALAALALTRPEGGFIAIGLLAFFWGVRRTLGLPAAGLGASLFALAVLVALLAWRVSVYGYPLPNTYYAKSAASLTLEIRDGIDYFGYWMMISSGTLLILPIAAWALGSGAWLRLLFVVGQLGVVVAAGGDIHPGFRFFLPVLPLLALDLAFIVDRVRRPLVSVLVIILALAATRQGITGKPSLPDPVGGFDQMLTGDWPFGSEDSTERSRHHAGVARALAELLPVGTQVAGTDVGALAYFSGLPVLDTFGLNDSEIAHLPKAPGVRNAAGAYRLDHAIAEGVPVVYLNFPVREALPFSAIVKQRACTPRHRRSARLAGQFKAELSRNYLCVAVPVRGAGGGNLNFFVRQDREDILLSLPDDATVSDCIEDFVAACTDAALLTARY